jgi:hypothetical protein
MLQSSKQIKVSLRHSFVRNLSGFACVVSLLCLLISFFNVDSSAAGTNYYVNAVTGNDNNPGTNELSPWQTITKAAATLQAGDTVYIMAGVYNNGNILPAHSGSAGAWITYSNYPGQQWQAVITNASFEILQKSYINVSGLKIENSPKWGIYVVGPGANYIISGNYTTNTFGSGIAFWGVAYGQDPGLAPYYWKNITNVLVTNNLIEAACNGDYNEQLDIANGVDSFIVCNNTIRNAISYVNGGEGIDCKEGASNGQIWGNELYGLKRTAIYLDAGASVPQYYSTPALSSNIQVFNNYVHDNGLTNSSAGIQVDSEGRGNTDGIYIYNNLVCHNSSSGIQVYSYTSSYTNYARNIYVMNNTVYSNDYIFLYHGGISATWTNASNVWVCNNISVSNVNYQIQNIAGVIVQSNLMANARFINAGGGDFHLSSTSPAIDTGTSNNAPLFDYDGNPRPWGLRWDIGAYEYSPTNPLIAIQFGSTQSVPAIILQGTVGAHYQLQWSSTLNGGGTWNLLQDMSTLPGSPYIVNDPTVTTQRFYRALIGTPY